jgi:tight adherence protein C
MNLAVDSLNSGGGLLLLILLFTFSAVALIVYTLMPDEKISAAKKMLGVVDESTRQNKIFLLKLLHPLLVRLAPRFVESKYLWLERYKQRRRKNIITGDLQREITPEEFVAFKVVMMFIFPILAHYVGTIMGKSLSSFSYIVLMTLGFFAPDLWLKELVKKRQRAIFRSLPYTMDILTLSVEAGLDFIAAIQRVATRSRSNPLIEELKIMLNEISLGNSRAEALRNLSERVEMEEISSFTTLLIQADQLGASIGPVLRAQSDSMRSTRFQRAEMKGARAAQMILFPMIFCIFPAIFIIIIGPVLVRLLTQGVAGLF